MDRERIGARRSVAGLSRSGAAIGQPIEPVTQLQQGCGLQPVVNPAALLTGRDQAGFLHDLEVKRELRLRQLQRRGEITDAALPIPEGRQHAQADWISQRPQKQLRPLESKGGTARFGKPPGGSRGGRQ